MAWGLLVAPQSLVAAKVKANQTGVRLQANRGVAQPGVLRALCDVRADCRGRSHDGRLDGSHCQGFQDRRRSRSSCLASTLPALVFALSLNRIFDGVGRPFFGWLSDRIGREYTMALAFVIGALALFTLSQSGTNPVVLRVGYGTVLWRLRRDLQSLPGNPGRYFWRQVCRSECRHALHGQRCGRAAGTRRGGPATSPRLGLGVHASAMTFNLIAAFLALVVLKPMRARHFAAGPPADGQPERVSVGAPQRRARRDVTRRSPRCVPGQSRLKEAGGAMATAKPTSDRPSDRQPRTPCSGRAATRAWSRAATWSPRR